MKRFLLICSVCLVATTLFAQQTPDNMDGIKAANAFVASSTMACPYTAAEAMTPDEDDPECLLCHPTGIPVGDPGNTGGGGLDMSPSTELQQLMAQTLAAR